MATLPINLNSGAASGNGIDVTAVVDQLMATARLPETLMKAQQAQLALQSAALATINNLLANLLTNANALSDASGALDSRAVTSSQSNILTASVLSSAAVGSHTIVVANLATTGSAYSNSLADGTTTFATGVFTLQVGANSTPITVDSSNNTQNKLAAYINSHSYGVTASVIKDDKGTRLTFVANVSGDSGNITIDNSTNTTGLTFNLGSAGANANLSVDSVPISSATNTITGAIPGVTLNLLSSAPSTPVTITISRDVSTATQAINNFVTNYNNLIKTINAQFTYNPISNTAGPLAADSSLSNLQSQVLFDVSYAIDHNNGIVNLASIGVNMNNDGTLTVDSVALNDALTNHSADVKNFFQQASPAGFATHLKAELTVLNDPPQD